MLVRESRPNDEAAVLEVHRAAFGQADEADLVWALMEDPTAQPVVSVLAEEGGHIIGHVLLTTVRVDGLDIKAMLLAPLATHPEAQGRGIGSAVVREAFIQAEFLGVELVFVLGHPDYYPRFGFVPAGPFGLFAPHPVPNEAAWMVRPLGGHELGSVTGDVTVADAISPVELWRE